MRLPAKSVLPALMLLEALPRAPLAQRVSILTKGVLAHVQGAKPANTLPAERLGVQIAYRAFIPQQVVAHVRLAQPVSLQATVRLRAQGVPPGSMQEKGLPPASPAERAATLPCLWLPHARLARWVSLLATVRLRA